MNMASPFQAARLSRRRFLVTAGSAGITVALGGPAPTARAAQTALRMAGDFAPNVWVTVAPDGIISIVCPASEMGQGISTTLPLLIAEEMDADWDMVRIVQAPADAEKYGNPGFYGIQLTGGSESTRGYFGLMRLTGAQTRKVMLARAATILDVPVGELTTEASRVVHAASGRALGYGEVAGRPAAGRAGHRQRFCAAHWRREAAPLPIPAGAGEAGARSLSTVQSGND